MEKITGFIRNHKFITAGVSVFTVLAVLFATVWFNPNIVGTAIVSVSGESAGDTDDLVEARLPQTTTLLDSNGTPFAHFYEQRRTNVEEKDIAPVMKQAIVSIEDRRFFEHNGVDFKGIVRAAVNNLTAGSITSGASTLEQQYVKNYNLIINEGEQDETRDYDTKLFEAAQATKLNKRLSKEQLLTNYLNTVSFGNGAYGIYEGAQTYFGIPPSALNPAQAALLAGLVQAPSTHDPYQNPEGATVRRNDVLDALARDGHVPTGEVERLKKEPLGILENPNITPTGCIAAGAAAHFCDYVRTWLENHDVKDYTTGGYVIRTSLDRATLDESTAALENTVGNPEGVTESIATVQPGDRTHRVLSVTASRPYGQNEGETLQPLTYVNAGDGAGSIFKIFVAAAGMDKGLGSQSRVSVPPRVDAAGLGDGGAENCPAKTWCVENAGTYKDSMTLQDALATSPNTPFVNILKNMKVSDVVDMSIKLGLRSYAGDENIQEFSNRNLGSYILGTTPINAVELSNVGATLSSGGTWCEPSPVDAVVQNNKEVDLNRKPCEKVMNAGAADELSTALSQDITGAGTAAVSAGAAGWTTPLASKTGTTDSSRSSAFLGYTAAFSTAVIAFNDGEASPLCTAPLRQCDSGDLYGGLEPAQTFFAAMPGLASRLDGGYALPNHSDKEGFNPADADMKAVVGMSEKEAIQYLKERGWEDNIRTRKGFKEGFHNGQVTGVAGEVAMRGANITLVIHDQSEAPKPEPAPEQPSTTPTPGGGGGGSAPGGAPGQCTINVFGVPVPVPC